MTISKQTVLEVTQLLDYINDETNSVDNLDPVGLELLFQLNKLNKKRISAILKRNKTRNINKNSSSIHSICYTECYVSDIFHGFDEKDIKKKFTLEQLQAMFSTIFKHKVSSSKNKDYIINKISLYYKQQNRSKTFVD